MYSPVLAIRFICGAGSSCVQVWVYKRERTSRAARALARIDCGGSVGGWMGG